MLDMKVIRENPELVKENIRKKFQDEKIALVDQVIVGIVKIGNKNKKQTICV